MSESRWIRTGGMAGILYVLLAVVAAALPGAPPPADGRAITFQNYLIAHSDALVAQGWLYALAAPLMLMAAVAVRRVLRESPASGYPSEVFLVGIAVVATLLVVAMAMQIVFAQSAARLDTELVYALGAHFGTVLIGLCGFVIALAASAYAYCVLRFGVAPRWTGCLAVLAVAVNLAGTVGVFIKTGAFSMEGGFSAWAPAASFTVWYLGTAIALFRRPASTT